MTLGTRLPLRGKGLPELARYRCEASRALIPNPWPEAAKRYTRNGTYGDTVSGVVDYGVFVNLEPGVDALCSHFRAGKVKKGDQVIMAVKKVTPEKQQIRGVIVRPLRRA